jgi:N-acetylmuramoyl-L-alanine amidase
LRQIVISSQALSAPKLLIFTLVVLLGLLSGLVLRGTGSPSDFVFFQQQGKKIVPAVTLYFQTYLPLMELLQLLDLPYTESASAGYVQIVVGKNIIRLTKDRNTVQVNELQIQLPAPVVHSSNRWLVAPEFIPRVMNRVLPEKIQIDGTGRRFCLGGIRFSRLNVRGFSSDQGSRFIIHLSSPVAAEIRKEQSRMILSFGNVPIDSANEDFQYHDSLVNGVSFDETGDGQQLVVQLADNTLRTRVARLADQNAYLLDISRAMEEDALANRGDIQHLLPWKKPGPTGRKWRRVIVDAGHGGRDRGALVQEGLYEKDVVLAIARKLRWALQSRLNVAAELSRTEDQSLSLDERATAANRAQTDLYLSIHIGNWNLPGESKSYAYVAKMRGTGKPMGGGEELDVVDNSQTFFLPWNRCQSPFLGRSSELAGMIQTELNRGLNGADTSLSYRQAPLRLLSSLAMPAVLVEIGNASQPDFKTTVVDPQFQNNVVGAILTAVEKFRAVSERP